MIGELGVRITVGGHSPYHIGLPFGYPNQIQWEAKARIQLDSDN
jgi:hypothetical protein